MINEILELGSKIENLWEKLNFEEAAFPDICFEELTNFNHQLTLEEFDNEVANWVHLPNLPKQLNVYNTFGQPPVTLFNNGKFVLDIYFWMYVDTSIHSHSFSGAFKVLYGRSIHEEFKIIPKKIFAPDIMSTDISRCQTNLISQNDCSRITQGNQFSHRLVHLDAPTVTLCARTINDKEKNQWHHFTNGLSIEKRSIPENVLKNLYYYQYLFQRDEEKALLFLNRMVSSLDISVTLNLYEQLTLDSMGLEVEAIEYLFKTVLKTYGNTDWFKIYENFYEQMQNIEIEFEAISPDQRFLEHAIINQYTRNEAESYLKLIQEEPINKFQHDLMNQLK
ncbi:MAG: hypothetical protein KC493_03980 [Bacteriovoracaceae bacterium]|nr:hypothetical protein [Bacteriovoracaceae bacterium]